MVSGYNKKQTCVFFMNFHYIWCPKYRRSVLTGKVATRCEELIREKVSQLDGETIALEVMPDHVHLFVSMPPTISANKIIGQVKGYTSKVLRQEFKQELKKLPTLWTRSYCVSTHGQVSSEGIQRYIAEQKGK